MKRSNSNYYKNLVHQTPALQHAIEDAQLSIDISMQISKLRLEAGLTQKELAARAGIQQSNISRLESPGYQGYTLKVLSKVVRSLGAKLRLEIIRPTITVTNRYSFYSESRNISSLKTSTGNGHGWLQDTEAIKEFIHVY